MNINITKGDIIWSYIGNFFNIASGFITLPLILNKLSGAEVGLNYLMLTIGTMVALLDFGFAPQFGRSITYVLCGAQKIETEGLTYENKTSNINYHLLATILQTAKYIYKRLSLLTIILMLTIGTMYIHNVTEGFTSVKYSIWIWLLYCVSTFFNIYYTYYASLLRGAALIKEARIANILSKLCYILIAYILLLCDCGLMSVVIANLIAPFVNRYYSHRCFYNESMKKQLAGILVQKSDIKDAYVKLWFNAKKLGINFIGAYCLTQGTIFISGLYLSLNEVASYGLLLQLGSIITTVSSTLISAYTPKFNKERTCNNIPQLTKDFAFAMTTFHLLTIIGLILLITLAPFFLELIKSNTQLPDIPTLIIFSIMTILNANHSQCATFITTANKVPFVKSSLISGSTILISSWITLYYTNLGILGMILSRFIIQLCYNDWFWPKWVLKDLGIKFTDFIYLGFHEIYVKIKKS